jgi:hypothetical protein
MQFNLPLHNNPEVRKRQRTKPKRIIAMNNLNLKTHHLLPRRNHSGSQNSHVLFVVTIITLDTVHIVMKWPNVLKGIPNLSCLLSLFLSNNIWLLKPPLQKCPSERKTLLAAIGAFDPESSNNIMFNLDNFTS